jgi:hypothetical protein
MFVHFSGVVIMIDEWAPFTVWLLVYFVYLFAKKAFISFSIQVPFDLVNNNLSFYAILHACIWYSVSLVLMYNILVLPYTDLLVHACKHVHEKWIHLSYNHVFYLCSLAKDLILKSHQAYTRKRFTSGVCIVVFRCMFFVRFLLNELK